MIRYYCDICDKEITYSEHKNYRLEVKIDDFTELDLHTCAEHRFKREDVLNALKMYANTEV